MKNRVKNLLSWLCIVVILAAGIYFFGLKFQRESDLVIMKGSVDHSTETYSEKTEDYEITAHYPIFTGLPEDKLEAVNAMTKKLIDDEISIYKKDASEDVLFEDSSPGVFNADTSVILESSDIISVRYNISTYIAGAAHPFNYIKGLNIDVARGRILLLSDFFEGEYVDRLSSLTREKLLQDRAQSQQSPVDQQQEQWIREGTSENEENFSSFVLTADSIIIFFNPYQVAPYASGIQQVSIPYDDIRGLIQTDSPLMNLMSR